MSANYSPIYARICSDGIRSCIFNLLYFLGEGIAVDVKMCLNFIAVPALRPRCVN